MSSKRALQNVMEQPTFDRISQVLATPIYAVLTEVG